MKKTNNLFIIYLIYFFVTSCSSREDNFEKERNNKGTYFKINIGIKDVGSTNMAKALISREAKAPFNTLTSISKEKMVTLDDVDVLIDAKAEPVLKSQASLSKESVALGSTPLEYGVNYRLLIYNASDNTLYKDVVGFGQIDPKITVEAGKQYKWYAISTNDLSIPTVDGNGYVAGSEISNKDILYASGTISTVYGENYLDIVFKHNSSRFVEAVVARGLFATINNSTTIEIGIDTGSGFTNIIKTGDLNIFTGEYSNFQDVAAVTGENIKILNPSQGAPGATKYAVLYTVKPVDIPVNSLRVKFGRLSVNMQDPLVNPDNKTREWVNLIVPYENSAYQVTQNDSWYINTRLVESGIKVANKQWARTNLYYDSNAQDDKWNFRADNNYDGGDQSVANTDFWNYRGSTPTGSYNDMTDPCTKVYPYGIWRMPSNIEFENLQNADPAGFGAYNITTGGVAFGTNRRPDDLTGNPSYPISSINLNFIFNGYRALNGQIIESSNTLRSNDEDGPTASVSYWTSDNWNDGNNGSYYSQTMAKANAVLNPPSFGIGPVTEGRQIRCVRK
ncbi:hypothetical protein HZP59_16300 [Elizabethkingia anophelis]|nr:hypothetical protein [Elizabethkingia anophelis]